MGYEEKLNAERALIFRIVHKDNVAWILENGLHCRNSPKRDPNYKVIGNRDLIDRRHYRAVPIAPNGTLSDYVPFYFTPFSPMMLNIHTGRGVPQLPNEEIAILVSSLRKMSELEHQFVFSDRHAYLETANFYSDLDDLSNIEWSLLQRRDFKRNPDDPEKIERYQAEALIHKTIPTAALLGIVCYNNDIKAGIDLAAQGCGIPLRATTQAGWYFR